MPGGALHFNGDQTVDGNGEIHMTGSAVVTTTANVPVPATAYSVTVTLPGRSESLAVHCAAPGVGP